MNQRSITIILASLLILLVMGVAWLISSAGLASRVKYGDQALWEQPFTEAQSMKVIDLTGDGQDELFLQGPTRLAVLDAQGQLLIERELPSPLSSTLGNIDGEGGEEVIAFYGAEEPRRVLVLDGSGAERWQRTVTGMADPARAALIRFRTGPQLILGDTNGQLVALDAEGNERWRTMLSQGDEIRGLDDALIGGERYLAAANRDGSVALYDAQGNARWHYSLAAPLRRLRAYDLDGDGRSELLLGGEFGPVIVLDAATGEVEAQGTFGQTVTEIRAAEIDGDPQSLEFVVGGKDGAVVAFRADGSSLWSSSLPERITEIASVDVNGDGAEEVVVGAEEGHVVLFEGRSGNRSTLSTRGSSIMRLDVGRLSAPGQLLVADVSSVELWELAELVAPGWYNPLLSGLLASLLIAGVAGYIATRPPKPTLRLAAEDSSVEGLRARRRMLHESIADVERLKQQGEMAPEAYLARLKMLRGELAETNAALAKSGAPVQVETFACPYCGGSLPLGVDRCDYCGQVVIA